MPPGFACPACATMIPAGAKFCPHCGQASVGKAERPPEAPMNLGKLPAPIPIGGIVFLVALVIGPAAIVAGIVTGAHILLYGGIAVALGIVILLLLGLVF